MKQSVIFLVIFAAIICALSGDIKAQTNPDGEQPSIHFTPYTQLGISDGEFCFNVLLKIPITETLTVSPFYEEFSIDTRQDISDRVRIGSLLKQTKFGATISFYFD